MAKKIIFLFVFLFLLVSLSFVSAAPPFQTSTGSDVGLTLRTPVVGVLKANETVTSHMHVFNQTNDLPMDNSTVNCTVHLYDKLGNHIVEQRMGFDSNGIEWELEISGGNFSEVGMYAFIVWCVSDNAGGFTSGGFDVTYSGDELSTSQSLVYILLFSVLGFIFVMNLFFIDKLPAANSQDEEGKIMSISKLKYLRASLWFVEWIIFVGIIFLASNVAYAYLAGQMFAEILFAFFTMCLALTPLVVIVWVVWIFVKMFHDKEFQKLLNRGFFPQGKL